MAYSLTLAQNPNKPLANSLESAYASYRDGKQLAKEIENGSIIVSEDQRQAGNAQLLLANLCGALDKGA